MSPRLVRAPDAFAAALDDTVLVLNVATGLYHGLEGPAGRIWDLLAEPRTLDELVAALCAEFEVSETDCRRDVAAFLDQLRQRGLLADQP